MTTITLTPPPAETPEAQPDEPRVSEIALEVSGQLSLLGAA
jgi:hypothetical protein